jgi:hypothetical protein
MQIVLVLVFVTRLSAQKLSFKYLWRIVLYGGKQWQPTPKNLPRMQCARAMPVA